MNYLKFIFTVPDDLQEFIIAELLDLDFYGFEQLDGELIAYVEKPRFNDSNREMIEEMMLLHPGCSFREDSEIEEQNWNENWERTIQPRQIGTFFVKPTWSEQQPDEGSILLEIDPKMAFGTSYHATTRLVLLQLSAIQFEGKSVLDAGTGTGILAIGAAKLGAHQATGFDIDPWSQKNALENIYINGVQERVDIRFGSTETIREEEIFDVVIANINRNVILDKLDFLIGRTEKKGDILLTGLLHSDEETIRNALSRYPVTVIDLQREEEWILFHVRKDSHDTDVG